MNIIEAIKSGKQFRRKHQLGWHPAISDNYLKINFIRKASQEELFADDWEVKDDKIVLK